MRGKNGALIPFAPPFLKDGDLVVSHVANILRYLRRSSAWPRAPRSSRVFANGLQLTVTDFVAEIHDTHHPISNALYYEDQKEPAKARAAAFLDNRLPKFLGYFERVLEENPAGPEHTVGDLADHVDLSLFQLSEGLAYAFPRAMAKFSTKYPALARLCASVRARPAIANYLASPRRLSFNKSGIFRHYPELDRDAS